MKVAAKAAITALVLILAAGCMGGRTIHVDVEYAPKKAPPRPFAMDRPLKIALIPFTKDPAVSDTLGSWTGLRGKEDTIKASSPVEKAVTGATGEYLERIGFVVETVEPGADLRTYSDPTADLVMAGHIKEFKVTASSYLGSTRVSTVIRLRVSIRNMATGSIVTSNVESSSEPVTVVTFDSSVFENSVNTVLAQALANIFRGTAMENGVIRPAD
ncbi:MAG TPA: hypothetical protein ENJ37_10875 [Deltaproteobacteria bacterium]|nr:hypothetical protein [Deltaproteobacteria bacterium]